MFNLLFDAPYHSVISYLAMFKAKLAHTLHKKKKKEKKITGKHQTHRQIQKSNHKTSIHANLHSSIIVTATRLSQK